MSFILRTWACQNNRCGATFDAGARYPACPKCGCVRVSWVPRGGHVGKVAGGFDRELRTLADTYGLTDLHSARQGEAVKQPAPSPPARGGVVNFNGFAANIDPAQGAQCVQTVNRITHKVRPGVGEKLTGQLGMPAIATNTTVAGRHQGDA